MPSWKPFWTDEVTIENGGRYPLLLNRFHDHLEEYLIKGIVSVTDRLRYISYCCWAIGDIEINDNCSNYSAFLEAFRRREGALAIGTYLLQPITALGNYTIYGERVMSGTVQGSKPTQNTSFKVLPSNELGAYSQYYKGTIQNWGLTFVDENGIVHLTELGKELYKIMDGFYESSEYYKKYKGKNIVPTEVLIDWAAVNQYDNITDSSHKKERDFFKSVIFHLDTRQTSDGRRDTFTIYLECFNELVKNNGDFNENQLRNILYYQKYIDRDGMIRNITLPSYLENTRFIWMIYEIHDYFGWWISEYLRTFLKLLSYNPQGLSIKEIIESVSQDSFNTTVENYLVDEQDYFNMLFGDFHDSVCSANISRDWLFEDELCYDSWENKLSSFSEVSAGMLIMFCLLNQRYMQIRNDSRYLNIRLNLSEDFWAKDILEIMDALRGKNIKEVLELILYQFVIRQHNNAMYEKRDIRRCWFTLNGNKYQHHADSNSIWRPAKHRNICNFLYDMGITRIIEDSLVLTEEGLALHNRLKDEFYEE